jgi:hypothetical protein
MQQSIAAQQAAARAATMKSATEAAAARAAEISRKLKSEGFGGDNVAEKDAKGRSRYSLFCLLTHSISTLNECYICTILCNYKC